MHLKKTIVLLMLFLTTLNIMVGQAVIPDTLTAAQSVQLNDILEAKRGKFDFSDKRIVFFRGKGEEPSIQPIQYYFNTAKSMNKTVFEGATQMHVLKRRERKAMGNSCDVIIQLWRKEPFTKPHIEALLQRLK
ncbi:MAG: hypothetical protein ACI9EQ_001903 [Bacteroidia bacterium]|jgi:hypothetical protein